MKDQMILDYTVGSVLGLFWLLGNGGHLSFQNCRDGPQMHQRMSGVGRGRGSTVVGLNARLEKLGPPQGLPSRHRARTCVSLVSNPDHQRLGDLHIQTAVVCTVPTCPCPRQLGRAVLSSQKHQKNYLPALQCCLGIYFYLTDTQSCCAGTHDAFPIALILLCPEAPRPPARGVATSTQ